MTPLGPALDHFSPRCASIVGIEIDARHDASLRVDLGQPKGIDLEGRGTLCLVPVYPLERQAVAGRAEQRPRRAHIPGMDVFRVLDELFAVEGRTNAAPAVLGERIRRDELLICLPILGVARRVAAVAGQLRGIGRNAERIGLALGSMIRRGLYQGRPHALEVAELEDLDAHEATVAEVRELSEDVLERAAVGQRADGMADREGGVGSCGDRVERLDERVGRLLEERPHPFDVVVPALEPAGAGAPVIVVDEILWQCGPHARQVVLEPGAGALDPHLGPGLDAGLALDDFLRAAARSSASKRMRATIRPSASTSVTRSASISKGAAPSASRHSTRSSAKRSLGAASKVRVARVFRA